MQRFPRRLPSEPRAIAHGVREPQEGPLDVGETATCLRVRLTLAPSLDAAGLCLGVNEVVLDRRLAPARRRVVFAHEIGHILIRRGVVSRLWRADEETLADQLGDEIALPSDWLEEHAGLGIRAVASLYEIPESRVAAQLARLGEIPTICRLESGEIVCASCGDRRTLSCRCLYYRVNRHKAARLPLAS